MNASIIHKHLLAGPRTELRLTRGARILHIDYTHSPVKGMHLWEEHDVGIAQDDTELRIICAVPTGASFWVAEGRQLLFIGSVLVREDSFTVWHIYEEQPA